MALTVTLSGSVGPCLLAIRVLTGASGSPGTTFQAANNTGTVKPTGSGSYVCGALYTFFTSSSGASFPIFAALGSENAIAQDTVNTISGGSLTGPCGAALDRKLSFPTVAGTNINIGMSQNVSGSGFNPAIAICEFLASGTIALDASAPSPVPTPDAQGGFVNGPLTTASFSPPVGSLLVALVAASDETGTPSVSDSTGLTWTEQISATQSFGSAGVKGNVSIWSAPVPAGTTASAGRGTATAAVLTALAALGTVARLVQGTGSALNAFVTTAGPQPGRSSASVGEEASCIAAVTGNGSRASVSGYGSSASVS